MRSKSRFTTLVLRETLENDIQNPCAIAVDVSWPLSPGATQHSLPSGRYPLLGPVFHRLDRTSLLGTLIRSPRRQVQESGQIHCEALKIGERAVAQSAFVSGAQDHAGRLARLECFLPTRSTEAPTVARFQAAKAEFRHRCRKIVAAGFGKLEKRGGHDGADRVATDVLSPSVAAAVSKEPRHCAYRTVFEPLTEHVTGCARPIPSITVVVPQHCRLRVRRCRPTTDLW